ncbi:MAG: glycosyl hydrolase [Bacteroidota bacterium]
MNQRTIASCMKGISLITLILVSSCTNQSNDWLKTGFIQPPDSARPGVYWYILDGNLDKEEITADLESMKKAGIGYALYQEVSNTPRGKVDFLSEEWQELYKHIVREGERLGIRISLGSSPGWTGSGGPWIKPSQSMQSLVVSSTELSGPGTITVTLPKGSPKYAYPNPRAMSQEIRAARDEWYEDVAVIAIPAWRFQPFDQADDKAMFHRGFYSWIPAVVPYYIPRAEYAGKVAGAVNLSEIKDITSLLKPDGSITWEAPPGKWTLLRYGRRSNGSYTMPAPAPGLGLECDKFDSLALNAHYDSYLAKLINKTQPLKVTDGGGWYGIHIDSWEVGSQNWSGNFREEFRKRRGYDLLPFLPVFTGRTVGNTGLTERFLWDFRETNNELVVNNYAGQLRKRGQANGLALSIQAYDSNPSADLDLGSQADLPMCEFWSEGFVTFNSSFSCVEAASIAHINNRTIVLAEAFTANDTEAWRNYPAIMKNQGDWALATGVNRMYFHTFAHKAHGVTYKPGITLGPWGVHWDRSQTWWPMIGDYHRYITRCQYILSQGKPVSEILYLAGEGAPHAFRPPQSVFEGDTLMPDHKGYAFDGCSPKNLMKTAIVKDHRIVFPGGISYGLMVLPAFETMTPGLLAFIEEMVKTGAIVTGNPPKGSPSLTGYPECDERVRELALKLWGSFEIPGTITERSYGQGKIFWGGELDVTGKMVPFPSLHSMPWPALYPDYDATAKILQALKINPDFTSAGSVRYVHRTLPGREVYFIANRTGKAVEKTCTFRDGTLSAELWDANTGEIIPLTELAETSAGIAIPIEFAEYQSFFVVFNSSKNKDERIKNKEPFVKTEEQRSEIKTLATLEGSWEVSFDPNWGGPESVVFESLTDWTKRPEEGIKYYSGIATYSKTFDLSNNINRDKNNRIYLNLGVVKNMARVRLNGKDLGVIWCAPWQVEITQAVKARGNKLEIEVANLWTNRLIGDENEPDDGVIDGKWPEWLLNGTRRPIKRYTFTTYHYYKKGDPLIESGLMGPVTIRNTR